MESKFEWVLNGSLMPKEHAKQKEKKYQHAECFLFTIFATELENEWDHLKTFWDLETLGIK